MPDTERKLLTITEVEQPVTKDRKDGKGKYQLLRFKAKDGEAEHSYTTIKADLFDLIKPSAILDCEVKTEVRDEWTNRSVLQIYQDGKPMTEQKKPWQGGRDSPEQRASIEAQVAAKIVAELWIAGKTDEVNPLVVTLKDWLFEKLGVKPVTPGKPPSAPAKPSESQPGKPANAKKEDSELFGDDVITPIDLEWLTKSLKTLQTKDAKLWGNEVFLARLNNLFETECKSIPTAVMKLTKEQAEQVTKAIQKALG